MTEAMQTIKQKVVLLAEFTEPEVRSTILHGFAVPFCIEPVGLIPLAAELGYTDITYNLY